MRPSIPAPPRTRRVLAAAAAGLLCLAGPAAVAAAQPDLPVPPPPGVSTLSPPPVDMSKLPSRAAAASFPYRGSVRQVAPCAPGRFPDTPVPQDAPAPQQRLRIRAAHQFATGKGQVVAVIDSGVNPHPRLAGRLIDGGDYILGKTGLADCEGHGTIVAGIIAAAPVAGGSFVGVAPDAKILSIRQSSTYFVAPDPDGEGTQPAGDTRSMALAVRHAVDLGATVINISEAGCYPAAEAGHGQDDALHAAVHYAAEHNVVVVVAAANEQGACAPNGGGQPQTIATPAWFDHDVLTVAATRTGTGRVAGFSLHGPWVDVAAPGTAIVSLDPDMSGLTDTLVPSPDGRPAPIAGTSFAAPYVAGLAALVRERFPQLSAREVIRRIERTAQHTAGIGGHTPALGFGVIDPLAALTDVLPPGLRDSPPPPTAGAQLQNVDLGDPEGPLRQAVALIGAGVGVAALVLTLLIVYTVKRYRHSALAAAYRSRARG